MKDHSPLIPSGSALEQLQRRKTKVLSTVFVIVAAHVLPITGLLLMQGCKPDGQAVAKNDAEDTTTTNEEQKAPVTDDELYGEFALQNNKITMPIQDVTNGVSEPIKTDPDSPVAPADAPDLDTGISSDWVLKDQTGGPIDNNSIPEKTIATDLTSTPKTEEVKRGLIEHEIKSGDLLSRLASKYNTTLKDILAKNPGVDPRKLRIGYKLFIPQNSALDSGVSVQTASSATSTPVTNGQKVYTVKAGDYLTTIAKNNGVSLEALRKANNINTHIIHPGQKLVIPVKTVASGR
ncbi:MAG: LysM peptidoglycan-binding domain-containing protein [Verrucomicrobiota bacterium]|jgi:LysM repeat protein